MNELLSLAADSSYLSILFVFYVNKKQKSKQMKTKKNTHLFICNSQTAFFFYTGILVIWL